MPIPVLASGWGVCMHGLFTQKKLQLIVLLVFKWQKDVTPQKRKIVLWYKYSQTVPPSAAIPSISNEKLVTDTCSVEVSMYELFQEPLGWKKPWAKHLNLDKKAQHLSVPVDNGWLQLWI